ncbi:MAG: Crp/Fnr family transcriptional regulator [bacterium]|nr:Crp/Fnr family transcriptional regulator [bacterium]
MAVFRKNLEQIWRPPNFISFFKKYSKRKPLNIKKGNMIFYQGDQPDRLYFIKKGFVKMYRLSEEGKNTVIYLCGPGSMLGVRALTSEDKCLRHDAQALTDVEILTMTKNEYLDFISENPNFLTDLLKIFIERLNITERKLEGFITTDATARIANFILDIANRFGERKNGKIIIPVPLTHQLIAEFVGSVRETATVALHELEKNKILNIEKKQIKILDLKKLRTFSSLSKSIH